MDGVILDSIPLHYQAAMEAFKSHSHQLTYDDYKRYFAGETDKDGFERYCALIGRSSDASKILHDKLRHYQKLAEVASFTACPGTLELIDVLKTNGMPLALVTGSILEDARLVLETFAIADAFGAVLTAEDVVAGKPDPDGYLQAAAKLGAKPGKCLVIEDSPSGIKAAIAAGMDCIALTTTYPASELRAANKIVDRLSPALLGL